jgi:formate-nitrite transporter family protein
MTKMTRRQMVHTLLRSAGGLFVVRYLAGCDSSEQNGNDNASGNGNANTPDSALLAIADTDHVQGDRTNPKVIIEYGDFQDTVCGSFFTTNLPKVRTDLVDTGEAAFVFRHFPLVTNANARLAAIASECAVDFFEYHDLLFNHQTALTRDALIGYAQEVGLDATAFGNCLDSGAKVPRVDHDLDTGTQLGVTQLPTFFVNGHVMTGDRTVDDFRARL